MRPSFRSPSASSLSRQGTTQDTETACDGFYRAFVDLEASVSDLKAELRTLQFSSAKEVEVKGGRKALVMYVDTDDGRQRRRASQQRQSKSNRTD